ncbi:MAG: nitrophenyl compound nitroreductase subunit ArsF family protein [Candidatus Omnitrophica bacterium]|nr:nitrophenyl compound nitroreductase subunit ArsF family protein [Candidatus Omnitrophota bacterium]MDD5487752.1 nitrophenyl compound nitroreductase subunit ArsF family protein [Candidatus Omnitrophota bacterium]
MRKTLFAFLAVLVLANVCAADTVQVRSPEKATVYYFHGSFRCPTCKAMEQYSKEAVETNFKDALASGEVEFKSVNVEKRGNEHFVEDYKLYTKTLILSMTKDGKEVKSKDLDKIWELARNKQKFIDYVTSEVKAFMKDAQ